MTPPPPLKNPGYAREIEDETHFLLDCKAYSQIRDIFFSKLEIKIPDFTSLSHDTLRTVPTNGKYFFPDNYCVRQVDHIRGD